MLSFPDWSDGNYMEWADQERLVRQDLNEIEERMRQENMVNDFEIEETIAVLSEEDRAGFKKELNLVSWRGRKPKYDIRGWKNNHTEMTKGISLSNEEMEKLSKSALIHIGVMENHGTI